MSIPQQVATPTPSRLARRPSGPPHPAPERRPVRVMLGICGLLTLTALGVALALGTVAVALLLVAANLTG
jgi:hypothetical protein